MKNQFKRLVSLSLALVMVLALSMTASAAYGWSSGYDRATLKDKAHSNADVSRNYFGMSDKAFPVRSQSLLWWFADGNTRAADSWYYDGIDGDYRDFYGNTITPATLDSGRSNGITFKYNGYIWYQIHDGTFYRWNGRSQIWATDSENRKILQNGTFQSNTEYDYYGTDDRNSTTSNTISWSYGGYTWYRDYNGSSWWRWNGNQKTWASSSENRNIENSYSDRNYSNNRNASYNSNGRAYSWNGYTWYQTDNRGYFRVDGNNYQVWASSSEERSIERNGSYLGSNYYYNGRTSGSSSSNTSEYNYNMFSGYNWKNGVIAPPYSEWTEDQARELLNITYNYVKDVESQTAQAQFMQAVLNMANGSDVHNAAQYLGKYQNNAPEKDAKSRSLLALARDVIWRNIARNNGWNSCYIVLPSEYNHVSIATSGGKVTFTFKTESGTVYTGSPESPYST